MDETKEGFLRGAALVVGLIPTFISVVGCYAGMTKNTKTPTQWTDPEQEEVTVALAGSVVLGIGVFIISETIITGIGAIVWWDYFGDMFVKFLVAAFLVLALVWLVKLAINSES